MNAHVETTQQIHLTSLLTRQRASFLRDDPPAARQRKDDLKKLKAALLARREALAKAVNSDFGHRSAYETAILDLVPTVHGIDYLRRRLGAWMRPQRRPALRRRRRKRHRCLPWRRRVQDLEPRQRCIRAGPMELRGFASIAVRAGRGSASGVLSPLTFEPLNWEDSKRSSRCDC